VRRRTRAGYLATAREARWENHAQQRASESGFPIALPESAPPARCWALMCVRDRCANAPPQRRERHVRSRPCPRALQVPRVALAQRTRSRSMASSFVRREQCRVPAHPSHRVSKGVSSTRNPECDDCGGGRLARPSVSYRSRLRYHEVRQSSSWAWPTLNCDATLRWCDGICVCPRYLRFLRAMESVPIRGNPCPINHGRSNKYRASYSFGEHGPAHSAERAWLSFRREKVPGNSRGAR